MPSMILKGEKYTTWRIADEKEIAVGDGISLCRTDGSEFGKAVVIEVRETIFGKMTEEDMMGHETFTSKEEMYRTYSEYYDIKVTPETEVKIIRFKLL